MTRDQNTHSTGGAKKFLYKGPKHRGSYFDDDEDGPITHNWNISSNRNSAHGSGPGFDLDGVWSIKNNVAIGKREPSKPMAGDWNMNAGKSYYSRHGGIVDNRENSGSVPGMNKGPTRTGAGWHERQAQKGFNYSYSVKDVNHTHGARASMTPDATALPSVSPVGVVNRGSFSQPSGGRSRNNSRFF